ncbi:phosphoribosylformylglycinamidine synthase, purS protein [candidate division WOR-1 bacterium RIFCSPLOWO2_02_FULL_46_20]|uniref:Phosphoribosylformylglycinamidine synthase subunit PurS n=2 Tax=Saganbacteria TaxID=1703751 RepID=A0A1F4RC84_UNCSA|nr:MAG: phosphoribosylformylglycinamidine synthase, purS protein [candidate division WOR-1 bacterium RIFCSPLOWO2_02_FULL_46_20]OGC09974.1 MAG: phosphoribosylformylglycinamidine synthase, purS protein [candidate division WOR-1 bacterium RIFCSPLOWO2_12_FULL_45_9]
MFEAQIKVTIKKTVADPQGLTVKHALESLDFQGIDEVRMGKFIIVKLKAQNEAEAKAEAEQMSKKLLANPTIEDFTVDIK